jgi:hypothetical protein
VLVVVLEVVDDVVVVRQFGTGEFESGRPGDSLTPGDGGSPGDDSTPFGQSPASERVAGSTMTAVVSTTKAAMRTARTLTRRGSAEDTWAMTLLWVGAHGT